MIDANHSSPNNNSHQHEHGPSNVPYGYYTLIITCFNTITITVNSFLASKLIQRRGKLKRSILGRCLMFFISVPIWLQVLIWTVIVLFIDIFPYLRDVYFLHKPKSIHYVLEVVMWKRAGTISYAMTPFIFLLSLRPNPIPTVIYMKLLPLHRWCSRIFVVLMVYHSIMFFVIWLKAGEFWRKTLRFDIFTGVISFLLWVVVMIVSIRPIRLKIYKTFYFLHMVATWSVIPLVALHAPNCKLYNYLNLAMLGYMVLSKIYCSVTTCYVGFFRIEKHINSQLFILSLPKEYYEKGLSYKPGSHLRIHYRLYNPLSWLLPSHPYSIASLDSDDEVKLIVKETSFRLLPLGRYNFSVPFDGLESGYLDGDLRNHNITVVCGGSGVAFGLPIYRYFLNLGYQSEGSHLHFIWITKTVSDLHILMHFGILNTDDEGQYYKQYGFDNIDIYITAPNSSGIKNLKPVSKFKRLREVLRPLLKKGSVPNNEVEMDSQSEEFLLGNSCEVSFPNSDYIHSGRPDLPALLRQDFESFNDKSEGMNSLLACGPDPMVEECSKLAKLNNAEFITESYNF